LKSYCKIQDRDDQREIREKLTGKLLTLDRTLEPTLPAFLTLLERRVFELNQQLVLAGAQTAEARARYELLRKAGASAGENLPLATQSTVLSALRAEYARLSRQSADQATVLGPRHPEVASLNAQIGDVRREIGAEINRMTASARAAFLES
jgi:uncharacterized protein involved in exopolysaccharide biosynthesis